MSREEAVKALLASGCVVVSTTRPEDYEDLRQRIQRSLAGTRPVLFSRVSQCSRKHRHASLDAARKDAKRQENPQVRAYRCAYCHGWHIGKRTR